MHNIARVIILIGLCAGTVFAASDRVESGHGPKSATIALEHEPGKAAERDNTRDCVLSSGPFALPDGTRSVDWKLVNRADRPVEVEVTVFQLRISEPARLVSPGTLHKTLPVSHEMHNANSVGHDKPFVPGLDYEVVIRRGDARVLPSVSFWSSYGNTEIPGTRIGPEGFVPIDGDCVKVAAND